MCGTPSAIHEARLAARAATCRRLTQLGTSDPEGSLLHIPQKLLTSPTEVNISEQQIVVSLDLH